MYQWKRNSWIFEGDLRVEIILDQKPQNSSGEFLIELYSSEHKITGKNIVKFLRGGFYKSSLQAEILQNYQEVEFINQYYRHK